MREIAEACDMSVGNLYRYIGSKDDVLFIVIYDFRSTMEAFGNKVRGNIHKMAPRQALEWGIREYCQLADKYRYLLMLSWREMRNIEPEYRQTLLNGEAGVVGAFENILRKGCQTGQFAVHNLPVVANNIVVLSELWTLRHWFLRDKSSLNEFIDEQVEFVCHGVCRDELGEASPSSSSAAEKKATKPEGYGLHG